MQRQKDYLELSRPQQKLKKYFRRNFEYRNLQTYRLRIQQALVHRWLVSLVVASLVIDCVM